MSRTSLRRSLAKKPAAIASSLPTLEAGGDAVVACTRAHDAGGDFTAIGHVVVDLSLITGYSSTPYPAIML